MIAKATLAILIAAASAYGGTQLIDAVKPVAEHSTAETTLRAVLANAQLLENLGDSRSDALAKAVTETPNADGIVAGPDYIQYQVVDTCLKGSFGTDYKYVIENC